MKILLVRNDPTSYMDVKHNTYNIQEVGLAKALIELGHECDIVFWSEKEEIVKLECNNSKVITVYYMTGRRFFKDAIFKGIVSLAKTYDIIQASEYNQFQSWWLANKYPEKTIIYHGPYYSSYNRGYNKLCKVFDLLFLRRYKKLATNFIAKSNMAKDFLVNKGLVNTETIGVGINLSALSTCDSEVPKGFDLIQENPGVIRLLYIGRIQPRRDVVFIYRVASVLKARGLKVQIVVVGNGDDDYLALCKQEELRLGLSSDIIMLGNIEQRFLSKIYDKCDFFLLPTHYEIFGMVLLEAMYYGLTCLTTENGGSDMLIDDEKNGFILPLDETKWADCIEKVWKDREQYNTIGDLAHRKIEENYTWEKLAPKFIEAYKKVLSKQ